MRIPSRPTVTALTPVLEARVAAPALLPQAQVPYQPGGNLNRLRKFGGVLMGPDAASVNAASGTLNRKAVAEAKELVRRAESLLGSNRAGDRSESYDLLRQAGKKLERVDSKLAAEFASLADAFYANDERARVFEGLLQWQFDRESAEKAAQAAGYKEQDPWWNLENMLRLTKVKAELDAL